MESVENMQGVWVLMSQERPTLQGDYILLVEGIGCNQQLYATMEDNVFRYYDNFSGELMPIEDEILAWLYIPKCPYQQRDFDINK